jgi:hypothetical protein
LSARKAAVPPIVIAPDKNTLTAFRALLLVTSAHAHQVDNCQLATEKIKSERSGGTMFALKRIRSIALPAITCAVLLSALSFAGPAGAATLANAACQAPVHEQIDSKCLPVAHNEALSPAASVALKKAFATSAGRAALQKTFRSISGAKDGIIVQSSPARIAPDWNCPGGASCGISGAGGTHFWFIASYAAIYNVGAFPFWVACTGALSPIIDPVAATLACGAVTGAIWALVNNAPWTTQHGVWMAVYWNHIADGFW